MSNLKRNFTITKCEDNISNKDDLDDILNFENLKKERSSDDVESHERDVESQNYNDIEKIHIYQYIDEIDTFIINSSNIYTLSVLGLIDKLIIKYNFKIQNIKKYISSSFGTLISVYLSFGYSPKDILLIFFEKIKLNGNILNIYQKYGIFELDIFIDELLKPLFDKLGYVPTLLDIYKNTGKNIVFLTYNLSLNKSVYFDFKNNPNDRIDVLVKTCCNIPIVFTKYMYNEHEYIDYTFISKDEIILSENVGNNLNDTIQLYKRIIFDTNTIKTTHNDVKNMNISEYIFYIFETLFNKNNSKIYSKSLIGNEIKFTIDTYSYDITLFLDISQRYKEFIKLYSYGFDTNCNFINIRKCQNKKNIDNTLSEINPKNIEKIKNISGVVFAGGGTNVNALLGMYKCLCDYNIISNKNIKTLIGTSAGSILALCFAMNFKSIDSLNFYSEFKFSENVYNSLKNISITDSILNKGILSNNILLNCLENIFIKYNDGIIPTLLDIKNKYDKELVCVTYNMTKNKLEYLNYKNSPELLVTYACVMSSCIPILFNPFEYKNNLYIDGAVGSNLPIELAHEHKDLNFACFGFGKKIIPIHNNLFEYLFKILYEKQYIYENEKIESSVENCEYFIYNKDFLNNPVVSSKKEILKIYNEGYKHVLKNYIKINN